MTLKRIVLIGSGNLAEAIAPALKRAGLEPMELNAKEGLPLTSGTTSATAMATEPARKPSPAAAAWRGVRVPMSWPRRIST